MNELENAYGALKQANEDEQGAQLPCGSIIKVLGPFRSGAEVASHVTALANSMSAEKLNAMRKDHENEYRDEVTQMYIEMHRRDTALVSKDVAMEAERVSHRDSQLQATRERAGLEIEVKEANSATYEAELRIERNEVKIGRDEIINENYSKALIEERKRNEEFYSEIRSLKKASEKNINEKESAVAILNEEQKIAEEDLLASTTRGQSRK